MFPTGYHARIGTGTSIESHCAVAVASASRFLAAVSPRQSSTVSQDQLRTQIAETIEPWRAALRDAVEAALGPSPSVRTVSDRLGIGRGTAHNLVRLLKAEGLPAIVASLPGATARDTMVERCVECCPDAARSDRLETAHHRLVALLRMHAPTAAQLVALVSDDTSDADLQRRLLRGFRSRFDIDRLQYGGSGRRLVACELIAPSTEPGWVSLGAVQVIDAVQRLRPGPPLEAYRPLGNFEASVHPEPLQRDHSNIPDDAAIRFFPGGESLVDEYPVYLVESSEATTPMDLAFLEVQHRIGPMEADGPREGTPEEPEETAELGCPIFMPFEELVFEVWFHRDVRRGGDPTARLYQSYSTGQYGRPLRERFRAPLPASLAPVGPDDDASLPDDTAARRRTILTEAASRLDTRFEDYTGFRLTLACPPAGSIFTIVWPLAIREG
jgi:hypothetical protein